MILNSISGVGILGIGLAFPEDKGRWFYNDEIYEIKYGWNWRKKLAQLGFSPDHYEKKFGYKKRYWTHVPGQNIDPNGMDSVDLMECASYDALYNAKVSLDAIDLIITVTTTSPKYTSSLATILAGRLGKACAAFEMRSGCSSLIYALCIAYQFINNGSGCVLIAAGETLSRITSLESSHLFAAGDGGSAIIIGPKNKNSKLISSYLDADGKYSHTMGVPGILPPSHEAIEHGDYYLQLSNQDEEVVLNKWKMISDKLLADSKENVTDIRSLITNQVSSPVLKKACEYAGIDMHNLSDCIGEYANCGPAGLLMSLHDAYKTRNLKSDDLVMLAAVGGGLAWGGMLLRI